MKRLVFDTGLLIFAFMGSLLLTGIVLGIGMCVNIRARWLGSETRCRYEEWLHKTLNSSINALDISK